MSSYRPSSSSSHNYAYQNHNPAAQPYNGVPQQTTYQPPAEYQNDNFQQQQQYQNQNYQQSNVYQSDHSQHHRKSTRTRHRPYAADQKRPRRKFALRPHFTAAVGEFVGTVMFLWIALAGTQRAALNTDPTLSLLGDFYVCLVFGLSLAVCAWAFYRISGGLFNPAVTIGMVAAGGLSLTRALFIFPAQILGGMAAAGLVSCMFPGPIAVTNTVLSNGTSIAQGIFIEMFMTALLVFTILMLAGEDNYAKPVAPVGIGLALFAAMLAGVRYTGGSLNPARSFGPAVASRSFPGYHYIYWIGPIMGALVAAGYVRYVKWLNYQEAQPDQDAPPGEKRNTSRHSSHRASQNYQQQ